MENKRLSVASSDRYLPIEICTEILSRVPAKSLLRFCCVSKTWLSMIEDPDFRCLHLNNFNNHQDETDLLAIEGHGPQRKCVVRDSNTLEDKKVTNIALGCKLDDGSLDVIGSIDGLVVLRSCRTSLMGFRVLILWNPSIRRFHNLPPVPEIERCSRRPLEEADIGIGYDPLDKDYKHVKLIRVNRDLPPLVAIYTLAVDSWKINQFQGEGAFKFDWRFIFNFMMGSEKAVCLRGSLYFITKKTSRDEPRLVSFDLNKEVFCFTKLPDNPQISPSWSKGRLRLVDGGCLLGVFDCKLGNVWVLESSKDEGESICWTKRYSFALKVPRPLYIKKNNDVLIQKCRNMRLAAGKEDVQQWWTMVSSYNLETEKKKILLKETFPGYKIFELHGYVQSLVMLKQFRAIPN